MTRLLVLRGNSASGKSSTASAVQAELGRSCALVQQDMMRRIVLKERDVPDGANIGLISTVARYALDHDYHVIVEGILHAERYLDMLTQLAAAHRGATHYYYLDVSLAESLQRHTARPQSAEFGAEQMRRWYCHRDLLDVPGEQVIPQSSSLESTVGRILYEVFDQLPEE